jgi:hypothetical protein
MLGIRFPVTKVITDNLEGKKRGITNIAKNFDMIFLLSTFHSFNNYLHRHITLYLMTKKLQEEGTQLYYYDQINDLLGW